MNLIEIKAAVFEYIEVFYNRKRQHSTRLQVAQAVHRRSVQQEILGKTGSMKIVLW